MNASIFWDVMLRWMSCIRRFEGMCSLNHQVLSRPRRNAQGWHPCQLTDFASNVRCKVLLLDTRSPLLLLPGRSVLVFPAVKATLWRVVFVSFPTCQSQEVAWGVTVGHRCRSGLIEISFTYSCKKTVIATYLLFSALYWIISEIQKGN